MRTASRIVVCVGILGCEPGSGVELPQLNPDLAGPTLPVEVAVLELEPVADTDVSDPGNSDTDVFGTYNISVESQDEMASLPAAPFGAAPPIIEADLVANYSPFFGPDPEVLVHVGRDGLGGSRHDVRRLEDAAGLGDGARS